MSRQLVQTTLWPHQSEDADYLEEEARALIGNDMGSGKTLLAVERDLRLREDAYEGPTLVVTPLNTHSSWVETFRRETDLRVKAINRKMRDWFVGPQGAPADVYVMHYEALRLMPELQKMRWGHVIADECHRIKGRKSKQTQFIKKIKSPYITDMSGTPVTDRPQDIWSILNHLKPQSYRAFWRFYEEFVNYEIIQPQGYHKVIGPAPAWAEKGLPAIRPFYVRRTKAELMPNLPPKLYTRIEVDLSDTQRRIYDEMKKSMVAWLESLNEGEEALVAPAVIAQLQRLQMIAIGTPIFDEQGRIRLEDPSTKVDAVMELLADNPGEQFVIFSQFKGPLRILKQRFDAKHIHYASFTGDDHQRIREFGKRDFIAGKRRCLLGTIGSGGVGVDGLQHASCNVIFIDRNWSPSLNIQAEDRLHRGGQTRNVNIFDIVAKDTVDAGRLQKIELKAKWIRQMLGDE